LTFVSFSVTRLLIAIAVIGSWPAVGAQSAAPIFTFESGFWLNLHHFLYVLGRAEAGLRDAGRRAVASAPADAAQGLGTLSPEEAATWRDAVTAYRDGPSRLDAVFDEPLIALTAAVGALGERDRLNGPAIPVAIGAALERAAPLYRRVWWPRHGRANQARIDEIQTLARLDGQAVLAFVTRAFGERWPPDGYPVQMAAYSNWAGAYSTRHRLLVMASLDTSTGGVSGLEIAFHEAMHQWDDAMFEKLGAAARRQSVARVPDNLSHAMIFYTAGEAVRRVVPDHVPYAEANGLWRSGNIAPFKAALDTGWRPYLGGRGTLESALDALLAATK
jgi:hypothetical protein